MHPQVFSIYFNALVLCVNMVGGQMACLVYGYCLIFSNKLLMSYQKYLYNIIHCQGGLAENWPRRLACAMRACVRHACLRAPCVAWPLFSPTFAPLSFSLLRLLLLTHFGESPMCEIIFHPIFWHN